MNQNIRKSNAIIDIIFALALLLFLAIWPAGIIHQTHLSKSDEVVATESEAVNVEHNLTQMFVAEGENLNAVDLYVTNEMQGETITFRLYDASYQELFNTFYVVKANQKLPGFVHIPVGYELIEDQEYYYTLEGLTTDLYVNLENTYESTSIVNGILAYAGEELPGQNVIIRYEYNMPFTWWQILLSAVLLMGLAAACSMLVKFLFTKHLKDKEIRVQTVFQVIFNPLIAIFTVIALYFVFPGRRFGTGALNYAFYGISILLFAGFLLYEVNHKRKHNDSLCTRTAFLENLPDYLQAVAFAAVLWYCFEYMNGLYDIHHAYATCRILIWFMLALITTYKKKELLWLPNLIWAAAGGIFAWFYAKPYLGIEEQGELYKLRAYVIVIGGFVILNMLHSLYQVITKKRAAKRLNLKFAIPFVLLLLLLFIFRNTREWPLFIIILCVLLYFRMAFWEKSSKLMNNLCNGILLNFMMMVIFSLCHRPFHYYLYYRYAMTYHTVTMTAVHLTLILAALLVKVYAAYQKKKTLQSVLPYLFFFGMACSYLLFTLSRTGFLASGFTIFVMLLAASMNDDKNRKVSAFFKRIGILLAAVIVAFPITFTITRTIPSLINDPVIYEVENKELSIRRGTPSDSDYYIDIKRFIAVFNSKVLGVGEDVTSKNDSITPYESDILLAGTGDMGMLLKTHAFQLLTDTTDVQEAEENDITNGRLDIYREYIKNWNMTGHPEMGVVFEDGSNSTHAHDIFLQVMHDQGLPVGIYFILFMAFSVLLSLLRMKNCHKTDAYQMLIPAILIGFLTAGITEWIFHPCNPFGMTVFIVMAPLFFDCSQEKKEQIDEKEKIN